MILLGPLVNAAVVLVAGIVGSLLKKGIPPRMSQTVTQGVGMCVLVIGIRGAIAEIVGNDFINSNIEIIAVISMALGVLVGELIDIDRYMNRLGDWVQARFGRAEKGPEDGRPASHIGEGLVSATMIFCVGAWAITGALASAQGDHTSLIAKAVVDGVTALMLASSLGFGVSLSSLSLLLYQGGLTVLFYFVGSFLSSAAIGAMGMVGSIVVMMVACNLIGLTRIRVANCIPAVFFPLIACFIFA